MKPHTRFRKHWLSAILLLTLVSIVSAAETQLDVISLQHRPANELLPILQPFVDKSGTMTADSNHLIIRTTTENLNELKTMIQRLDQAAKRLLVEVRQSMTSTRHDDAINISNNHHDNKPRIQTYSTGHRGDNAPSQQIQVLEGHTAFIKTGRLIPMATQQMDNNGHVVTMVNQQDVSSGFQVTPYLNGGTVRLEISPFSTSPSNSGGGITNQQVAATTVSGALGEWITIGSANTQQQQSGHGIIYQTHNRNEQDRQIQIRVTEQ